MTVRFELIPTEADGRAFYSQTTNLGGRRFRLRFDWIQRANVWHLSLYSASSEPLLTGVAVVPGVDLLSAHKQDPALPQGALFVYDPQGRGVAPGLLDLGRDRGFRLAWAYDDGEAETGTTIVASPGDPGGEPI